MKGGFIEPRTGQDGQAAALNRNWGAIPHTVIHRCVGIRYNQLIQPANL